MVHPYFSCRPHRRDIQEFVLLHQPPCTCLECQLLLYSEKNCNNTHLQVQRHLDNAGRDLGPNIVHFQSYEALRLVQIAIAYFHKPEQEMDTVQRQALECFRSMNLRRLGWQNGPKAVAVDHLQRHLRVFQPDILLWCSTGQGCVA
jgi:hypothetical protein